MVFEKVVNEDIILEKRNNNYLFLKSDFPKSSKKSTLFEARNCYISIEKLENEDKYFVQFAKTIDILYDKKGTIVVDGVYENFIDDMQGAIEYLNAYLHEEVID